MPPGHCVHSEAMPKLLVIADDLSGATDVGVQFAREGVRAFVTIQAANACRELAELFAFHEVVLVDIESRHVSPDEAARRVTAAVAKASAAGIKLFYKKTDSTLRGNVGAELDALLKSSGERTLCFLPAHPALGRTTRDGVHFVHGKPLHESAFAIDPRSPVSESYVATVLARQAGSPVTLVRQNELEAFAQGPPAGLVLFDAETEADVRRAASAIQESGRLTVLAGSAAFASCLPELVPFARESPARARVPGRLLVINGSLNEVAFRQCSAARKNGFASVSLTAPALLADRTEGEDARITIADETVSLLANGHDVVLGSVQDRDECASFEWAGMQISSHIEDWPERIALNTGHVVRRILSRREGHEKNGPRFALVVFGGDTLAGIARANGWKGFVPRDEILPGVAVCEVREQRGLVLLTKPGGFGDEDVLLRLRALATP